MAQRHDHGSSVSTDLVQDPVCGMTVDSHTSEHHTAHEGRTYFFCSARCQARFEANPGEYVRATAPSPSPSAASAPAEGEVVEYTCPMHPEIRRAGPGSCPICGMALEPVTGDRRHRSEPRAART